MAPRKQSTKCSACRGDLYRAPSIGQDVSLKDAPAWCRRSGCEMVGVAQNESRFQSTPPTKEASKEAERAKEVVPTPPTKEATAPDAEREAMRDPIRRQIFLLRGQHGDEAMAVAASVALEEMRAMGFKLP